MTYTAPTPLDWSTPGSLTLLYGYDGAWAKDLKMSFWDPQRVYDWIGEVHQGRIKFSWTFTPFKAGKKSLGVEIDARDVAPPQEPIWDVQTRHLGVELKQD